MVSTITQQCALHSGDAETPANSLGVCAMATEAAESGISAAIKHHKHCVCDRRLEIA
jgi:hypothetical protein